MTLPAGWTPHQATKAWDGTGTPFHDVPEADQFVGPGSASAWFFGAPTSKALAARVKESIDANAAEHASTCPPVPDVTAYHRRGDPGTMLGFDRGFCQQRHHRPKGKSYLFGFPNPAVHVVTDPTDRALFVKLLESVQFPD